VAGACWTERPPGRLTPNDAFVPSGVDRTRNGKKGTENQKDEEIAMAKEILCAYGVDVDAVAGWAQ
jgi:hypothetical protein